MSRRRSRRSRQLTECNPLSRRAIFARPRKIKRPQKPRLIRRYIIKKKVDPNSNGKQPSVSDLHATARISRPTMNPGKFFGYGPHDVVTDKKVSIKQPAEINTIPNPIPDTGPIAFGSIAPGSPLLGAIRDTSTFGLIIPPTPPPPLPLSITPPGSVSALPPLQSPLSVTSPILIDTVPGLSSSSSAIETSLPKSPSVIPQTTASKVHSVNLAVIILLVVGSALLLLGSYVLIKVCARTRRKDLPKPSLPIFEDADPEADFFETKESPVFGGKERLSPMPEPAGAAAWTWIQYPHARLTQPVARAQRNSSGGPHTGSHPIQPELGNTPTDASDVSALVVPTTSLHTLRRHSIYSPRSCANIAQAITHDRLTTANGDEMLTQSRSRPRNSLKRRSQLVRDEKQRHRESAASTVGLAYDGDYVASPSLAEYTPVDTPVIGYREGRERIKSSYFTTGPYPMVSNTDGTAYSIATATRVNVGQRNSFNKGKFSVQNSNSKWQRDTQALTYALGLSTPETNYLAQSPQPTLYPDDSLSVVDTNSNRKPSDTVPDIPVIIPDKLMNLDFRLSQMSLSEMTVEDERMSPPTPEPVHPTARPMPGTQSSSRTGLTRSSYSGMPPRVPSPPPLPSLSQMALAQHNPVAYANYHSPTYSLYGLYESPDRQSIIR